MLIRTYLQLNKGVTMYTCFCLIYDLNEQTEISKKPPNASALNSWAGRGLHLEI